MVIVETHSRASLQFCLCIQYVCFAFQPIIQLFRPNNCLITFSCFRFIEEKVSFVKNYLDGNYI